MHKEARLNTNEMLTKTVQTGHPKDRGGTHAPTFYVERDGLLSLLDGQRGRLTYLYLAYQTTTTRGEQGPLLL